MFEIHLLWPHLRQKITKRVDGVYATLFPILSIFSDFCLIECFLIPIFQKKIIIFFFNDTFFRNLKQSVLLLEEKLERDK